MLLVASAFAGSRPSCFPLSEAVGDLVWTEHVGDALVVVEERTVCEGGGPVAIPQVPKGLFGRDALALIVDLYNAAHPRTVYGLYDRAGGWLVAPVSGDRLVDLRVGVDSAACPTVEAAERCIFDQISNRMNVGFGMPSIGGPTLPNSVTVHDVPVLEAFRSLYEPHERATTCFALQIDREIPGRPGRRVGHHQLMMNPLGGGAVIPPMAVAPLPTPD